MKNIKNFIKKTLAPHQIDFLKIIQNNFKIIRKRILRNIYSGNILRLAVMNLIDDSVKTPQIFNFNNEKIYFKSWKNSYIGAILKEIYIDQIYKWFFVNKKNEDLVILDIGANVGLFTQYARRFAKQVFAVEPSSESFDFLERVKKENHWDNVECVKAAISDKTRDSVKLFNNQENTTTRSLNSLFSDGSLAELVNTLTLTDLFKKYNIQHVDFMKLDVEGAELPILTSDNFKKVLPFIDVIHIDFHLDEPSKILMLNALRSLNLNITQGKTPTIFIVEKNKI